MKLKKVTNSEQVKNYKININLNSYFKNRFCVGDTIQNKEDNLIGIIDKIKNGTIYVKYKDNTIERINELNAKDYIDFADVEVEPIIQEPTQKQHTTVNKRNLQNIQFTQDVPIDKLAEKEYNKLKETKQQLNKEQEVENLIRLAIAKNMIDKDDYEFEKLKALSMDEQDFEDYKDEINNFSSQSVVSSSNDDEEDANLTEAERMLKQIKTGKMQTAGNVDFDKIQSDTRDLSMVSNKSMQKTDNLLPIISPTPSNQGYNKYDWMNEIEWTMGSRN